MKSRGAAGARDPFKIEGRRPVGAVEGAARGLGGSYAGMGRALAAAGGALPMLGDFVASKVMGRPVTGAQDAYFGATEPAFEAPKYYDIDPKTEELTTGGKVGNVAGNLAGIVQQMFAMPGAVAPNTGKLLYSAARAGAPIEALKIAAPQLPAVISKGAPFIVPPAITAEANALDAGASPGRAQAIAAANALTNTAMVALPLSAAGGAVRRFATAVPLGVASGIPQRAVVNEVIGDQPELQQLKQPVFGAEQMGTDALLNGVMSLIFGPRAAATASRRPATGDGDATRVPDGAPAADSAPPVGAQFAADFERYRPFLEANGITDPASNQAQIAVKWLNQREAKRAERRPIEPGTVNDGDLAAPMLDQINLGERNPAQTPWAGRTAEPAPVIRAGERPGVAFAETPGNLEGQRVNATITPDDVKTIAQHSGLSEAEITGLGPQSQARLLGKAREAAAADAERSAAGPLRTSFTGGEDGQADPISQPNVPGDRAPFNRGVQEDQAARSSTAPEDITPEQRAAAGKAAERKTADIGRLDALRKQKEAFDSNPAWKELNRRGEAGMLDEKSAELWRAKRAQRASLGKSIFDLESRIYDTEATSDLGSKAASGNSDRPFRARDTGNPTPEQSAKFEADARAKAAEAQQKVLDDLEAEWRAREELRNSRRQRAQKEPDAGARYADSERSENATRTGQDYNVDADGFVMSDKGAPIWFDHQRKAGWWILKKGNKDSPHQVFEIANHPSGSGFTVRQTSRGEPPGSSGVGDGRAVQPRPGGESPPQGPPPRPPEAPRAPDPAPAAEAARAESARPPGNEYRKLDERDVKSNILKIVLRENVGDKSTLVAVLERDAGGVADNIGRDAPQRDVDVARQEIINRTQESLLGLPEQIIVYREGPVRVGNIEICVFAKLFRNAWAWAAGIHRKQIKSAC